MVFNLDAISQYVMDNVYWVITLLFLGYVFWLGFGPYFKLRFYANQGIPVFFVPFLGPIFQLNKDLREKGDILAGRKEAVKKDKNCRMLVTHIASDISVHIADPMLIKEFYNNQDHYKKSVQWMGAAKLLFGNGLVSTEGQEWKKQRKIISKLFHYEHTKSMIPHIIEIADELFNQLSAQKDLSRVPIMLEFEKITGDVVGRTFFGKSFTSIQVDGKPLSLEMASLFSEIYSITVSLWNMFFGINFIAKGLIPSHRPILRRVKRMKKLCYDILQEKKKSKSQGLNDGDKKLTDLTGGLIDLLLETQIQDEYLTDDEIVDEIITFFIAGMDTTGHLCAFCVWMMTQYPDTVQKIQDELTKTIGSGSMNNLEDELQHMNLDNLNKLEYLTAFIKETLRLWTPVPILFFREAIDDHMLGDIKIKKGSIVTPEFTMTQMNPKYFENPEKFNPERWFDNSWKQNLDPFCFIPFSAGPRNCIGQHLAMIEAKIILIKFIRKFDFSLIKGYKMKFTLRSMYEPEDELLMVLKVKNNLASKA